MVAWRWGGGWAANGDYLICPASSLGSRPGKKMLLWWRLREESGHKKSKQQNGILAQEEEAKEIKPNKSTYLPSDEHLSASFIFPSTYNL